MTFEKQQRILAALIVEVEHDLTRGDGDSLDQEELIFVKSVLSNCRSLLASIHEEIERQRKERKANMLVQE